MSYGNGLSYGGARSIARRPPAPSSATITRASPHYPLARAGYVPQEEQKLWGSLPLELTEGHQGDPFYDVRFNEEEGLGAFQPRVDRDPKITGGKWSGDRPAPWLRFGGYSLGPGMTATPARPTPSALEPEAGDLPGSGGLELGNIWPIALALGALWFLTRR